MIFSITKDEGGKLCSNIDEEKFGAILDGWEAMAKCLREVMSNTVSRPSRQ